MILSKKNGPNNVVLFDVVKSSILHHESQLKLYSEPFQCCALIKVLLMCRPSLVHKRSRSSLSLSKEVSNKVNPDIKQLPDHQWHLSGSRQTVVQLIFQKSSLDPLIQPDFNCCFCLVHLSHCEVLCLRSEATPRNVRHRFQLQMLITLSKDGNLRCNQCNNSYESGVQC